MHALWVGFVLLALMSGAAEAQRQPRATADDKIFGRWVAREIALGNRVGCSAVTFNANRDTFSLTISPDMRTQRPILSAGVVEGGRVFRTDEAVTIAIGRRLFTFPGIRHLQGSPAPMLVVAQSEREFRLFLEMTDVLSKSQGQQMVVIVGSGRAMEFSLQGAGPAMAEAQWCAEQQGYISPAPSSSAR